MPNKGGGQGLLPVAEARERILAACALQGFVYDEAPEGAAAASAAGSGAHPATLPRVLAMTDAEFVQLYAGLAGVAAGDEMQATAHAYALAKEAALGRRAWQAAPSR